MPERNVSIRNIPMPKSIARLPVNDRGYPIPWFVGLGPDGKPDFRIYDGEKMVRAVRNKLCWICGTTLGVYLCFPIGPMCSITKTSQEPPSHLACCEFSARACPFLSQPRMRRNEAGLDKDKIHISGVGIMRNPGVTLLWCTKRYSVYEDHRGHALFDIGEPTQVFFYREGRKATRAEILESIDSGMPILKAEARKEGSDAEKELMHRYVGAMRLLPNC